jgi:cysteine-rich repeat protein
MRIVLAVAAALQLAAADASVCGDGKLEDGEACDDGNTRNGDGCDADCQVEVLPRSCGNGVVEAGEACDDGNAADGDGCNASCRAESEPCGADCELDGSVVDRGDEVACELVLDHRG